MIDRIFAACLLALAATAVHAAPKPNMIFIMADDLGYADLGCYGSSEIETPYLDRLASGGVRCTDFHSNGPVCSPTRAALMTGRYQQRSGVSGVITALSHRDKGMALEEWTIAEAMGELGYRTALFGKWHLGYPETFNPVHQGFDEFKGFVSGNVDYHRHIDQEGHFDWWQQNELKDDPGYITDLISDYGVDFIRRNKNQPFVLMLTHGAPHYPIQNRETPGFRVTGKINRKQPRLKLDDPKAVYRDMIEIMDEGIGRIVAEVEAQGLRERTLIIFCSDNGPASLGSAGPYRAKKGSVYEGGHRVPAIFNWPETLPAGTECNTTLLTMDMLPTFVTLAGGEVDPSRQLDGVSILPALNGESLPRGPLFWQFKGRTAVRVGDWKMVTRGEQNELYNLASDPSEKQNVAQSHPEIVKQLSDHMQAWQHSVSQNAPVVSK